MTALQRQTDDLHLKFQEEKESSASMLSVAIHRVNELESELRKVGSDVVEDDYATELKSAFRSFPSTTPKHRQVRRSVIV
jgi:hypothetical protein